MPGRSIRTRHSSRKCWISPLSTPRTRGARDMTDTTIRSLDELGDAGLDTIAPEEEIRAPREPVRDELNRSYATGKRKESIARVWVRPGNGQIVVNGKAMNEYFARPVLQMLIGQPFQIANVSGQFDVTATVKGGGLSGQAGAVKHGISKALSLWDPEMRTPLKAAGFLTRDARTVERKKYGRAKARKSFQFSKR